MDSLLLDNSSYSIEFDLKGKKEGILQLEEEL